VGGGVLPSMALPPVRYSLALGMQPYHIPYSQCYPAYIGFTIGPEGVTLVTPTCPCPLDGHWASTSPSSRDPGQFRFISRFYFRSGGGCLGFDRTSWSVSPVGVTLVMPTCRHPLGGPNEDPCPLFSPSGVYSRSRPRGGCLESDHTSWVDARGEGFT
jgi:hypothetical protein